MDTGSFIAHLKTDDIYKDIAEVDLILHISNQAHDCLNAKIKKELD